MCNKKCYSASGDKSNLIWISLETKASAQLVICNIPGYYLLVNYFILSLINVIFFVYWAYYKMILLHLAPYSWKKSTCRYDKSLLLKRFLLRSFSIFKKAAKLKSRRYSTESQAGTIQHPYFIKKKKLLRLKKKFHYNLLSFLDQFHSPCRL